MKITDARGVNDRADAYFLKTKAIVQKNADSRVTYAVFLRTDCVMAVGKAVEFLEQAYASAEGGDDIPLKVDLMFAEGAIVPAGLPLLYVTGSMAKLSPIETTLLQRVGFACVSAFNAMNMCLAMKKSAFLAMDARHCPGDDLHLLAEYGASVGSKTARIQGAKGFVGTSTAIAAPLFGGKDGLGTMPHALIGYAKALKASQGEADVNATLEALKLYVEAFPDEKTYTVLVDFDGKEVSDAVACCKWFFSEGPGKDGRKIGFRLDTHGGRYLEGLDWKESVNTLLKWTHCVTPGEIVKHALRDFDIDDLDGQSKDDIQDKYLFGTGVTAANVVRFRKALDDADFKQATIVASSGFDVMKCRIFGNLQIPVDVVGTGSFLPRQISKTYATADIVRYEFKGQDGAWSTHDMVKVGREHLLLPAE